jgi:hypothetical protein
MNQTPLLILTTGLADYLTDGKNVLNLIPTSSIVSLFDKIENNFNLYMNKK